MATTKSGRSQILFWLLLIAVAYIIVSVGVAVSTSDVCGGGLDGAKTWNVFPPGWECNPRSFG